MKNVYHPKAKEPGTRSMSFNSEQFMKNVIIKFELKNAICKILNIQQHQLAENSSVTPTNMYKLIERRYS